MPEYPSNSNASREPAKKEPIERVTQSEAFQRKKSVGKRFSETFLGGDARSVGSYIFFDVFLSAARDMVVDMVTMGAERMFYGESRPRASRGFRPTGGFAGHTNYNRVAAGLRPDPREAMSHRARATHDFGEIIIDTRVEAEAVVDKMFHQIEKYGQVTVADLYDLVGITSAYTDNKWGWIDLQGTDIRRTRDGYLLKLPPPDSL
jgi:hypothetical protein